MGLPWLGCVRCWYTICQHVRCRRCIGEPEEEHHKDHVRTEPGRLLLKWNGEISWYVAFECLSSSRAPPPFSLSLIFRVVCHQFSFGFAVWRAAGHSKVVLVFDVQRDKCKKYHKTKPETSPFFGFSGLLRKLIPTWSCRLQSKQKSNGI